MSTINTAEGAIEFTIPLTITVRLGEPVSSQKSAAPDITPTPPETFPDSLLTERVLIDSNYANREGYDPAFLGQSVARPALTSQQQQAAARNTQALQNTDPFELRYHHFSVVVNQKRRLAFYTVVNIDGRISLDLGRDADSWSLDPRIPAQAQIENAFYGGNDFDKGHITRRLDPAWGTSAAIARSANDDTFHLTNCSPQHKNFNRNQTTWAGMENYVLHNIAPGKRVTVFNGPILADTDPTFNGVQIPLAFWKIVVFLNADNKLSATAFLLSQQALVLDLIAKEAFRPQSFQVPIARIIQLTGLNFQHLTPFDPIHSATPQEIKTTEGVLRQPEAHPIESFADLTF